MDYMWLIVQRTVLVGSEVSFLFLYYYIVNISYFIKGIISFDLSLLDQEQATI